MAVDGWMIVNEWVYIVNDEIQNACVLLSALPDQTVQSTTEVDAHWKDNLWSGLDPTNRAANDSQVAKNDRNNDND